MIDWFAEGQEAWHNPNAKLNRKPDPCDRVAYAEWQRGWAYERDLSYNDWLDREAMADTY